MNNQYDINRQRLSTLNVGDEVLVMDGASTHYRTVIKLTPKQIVVNRRFDKNVVTEWRFKREDGYVIKSKDSYDDGREHLWCFVEETRAAEVEKKENQKRVAKIKAWAKAYLDGNNISQDIQKIMIPMIDDQRRHDVAKTMKSWMEHRKVEFVRGDFDRMMAEIEIIKTIENSFDGSAFKHVSEFIDGKFVDWRCEDLILPSVFKKIEEK